MKIIVWKCKKCNDLVVSYARRRYNMNFCKCGSSAVDLEPTYVRIVGGFELIKEFNDEEISFNLELLLNYFEQIGELDEIKPKDWRELCFFRLRYKKDSIMVIPEEYIIKLNKLIDELYLELI